VRLLSSVLLLAIANALSAATFYIDADCANNGDGSTTSCAASGGAPGAFNALPTTITASGANEYYIKRGTTLDVDGNQATNITNGGTSEAARLVIGAYGSGADPIVRGNFRAILISDGADFITIQDLEFSDMALTLNESAAIAMGNDVTDFTYVTIQRVTVRNITTGAGDGTSQSCLKLQGRGNKVLDSTISGCSQDGIWFKGDYTTIDGNTIENVSTETVFGDNIQGSTDANYFTITDNILDHTLNPNKQCFVLADADLRTDTGGGLFQNNYCVMGAGSVTTYGVYTEQPNSQYIGNEIHQYTARTDSSGFVITTYASGTTAAGNKVIIHADGPGGFSVGSNNTKLYNNTVVKVAETNTAGAGIDGGTGKTGWQATNNIVQGFFAGLEHDTSGYTDTNNLTYNNTTNCTNDDGTSRSCDASTVTSNPTLDGNYKIGSSSPAWGAGKYVYPHRGRNGKCGGSTVNIGATCANPVPYGYTLKPKRRR